MACVCVCVCASLRTCAWVRSCALFRRLEELIFSVAVNLQVAQLSWAEVQRIFEALEAQIKSTHPESQGYDALFYCLVDLYLLASYKSRT